MRYLALIGAATISAGLLAACGGLIKVPLDPG
jgi:hypothetical protein